MKRGTRMGRGRRAGVLTVANKPDAPRLSSDAVFELAVDVGVSDVVPLEDGRTEVAQLLSAQRLVLGSTPPSSG